MDPRRRTLLTTLGLTAAAAPLAALPLPPPPAPGPGRRLGLAMVGLGRYATDQVAVGLEGSAYWDVRGVVTGTPAKAAAWQATWGIADRNVFDYAGFDDIAARPEIDAVYICLPNAMHAEFAIRAARAGKHVIVEKPMATSVEDAARMVRACEEAGVKLAVGYRLHFNRHHLQVMQWGRDRTHGRVQYVNAMFAINVGEPGQWRLRRALSGGGSLMDVGIYCVQAARYATGSEPSEVTAQFAPVSDAAKFAEVEDGISWQMALADGTWATGYSAYHNYVDELYVAAEQRAYTIEPAFSYGPLQGEVREQPDGRMDIAHEHHQRAQMEALGALFLDPAPLPAHISGAEGLRDLRILMAIYEAARSGRTVRI